KAVGHGGSCSHDFPRYGAKVRCAQEGLGRAAQGNGRAARSTHRAVRTALTSTRILPSGKKYSFIHGKHRKTREAAFSFPAFRGPNPAPRFQHRTRFPHPPALTCPSQFLSSPLT